ncbi:MAG: CvpA family protein [Bacteroidetes bacterium]|nr:CvpA family protein [Bacteroidota bacterium]
MTLDITILSIILIFFIRGYMKGIIVAVFSAIAMILGLLCALKLSGKLAQWMLDHQWISSGWAQLIAYAILFFGVVFFIRLVAKAVQSIAQLSMLGWLNGLMGGVVYGFMAAVVCSSVLWISNQIHLLSPETKTYSKTYSYIEPLAPKLYDEIGNILPIAKNVFFDLQTFFDNANQSLPEHVGSH